MTFFMRQEFVDNGYAGIFSGSDNFAILFNYFIAFDDDQGEGIKINKNWISSRLLSNINKQRNQFKIQCGSLIQKQTAILAALNKEGFETSTFRMKTDWRFIPGLGSAHICETGMSLNHIYGLPYLGGSTCKGITRQYVLEFLLDNDRGEANLNIIDKIIDAEFHDTLIEEENAQEIVEIALKQNERTQSNVDLVGSLLKNEKQKERLKKARKIFGTKSSAGQVIFLEAVPVAINPKVCILNPHHGEYYRSSNPNTWPNDEEKPIPKKFLTLENSKFSFALAVKKNEARLLKIAAKWLKNALEKRGAGAKTSVNYGYFNHYDAAADLEEGLNSLINKINSDGPLDACEADIRDYFTNYRQQIRDDKKSTTDDIVIAKISEKIKSCQSSSLNTFLIETVFNEIPKEKAKNLAIKLIQFKKFQKSPYIEALKTLVPDDTNKKLVQEIISSLKSADKNDLPNAIKKSKNQLNNPTFTLEDKQQITQALLDISSDKKHIKKQLKKAIKEANKILAQTE